ncbi:MAG: hypothetical protein QXR09_02730 [Candidatus Aenigmatarchaeota archaeon]
MEIVLSIEQKNLQKVKDLLLKDDVVSRASIIFKEAKSLNGREGIYCYISGLEEQCKRALEKVKVKNEKTGEILEIAREVSGEEKEEVISKIKEEENRALEGFGGIFRE